MRTKLPAPGVRFVTEPSDEVIVHPGDDLIDLGNRMLILPEHEAKSRPPDSHGGAGDGSGEHVDDAAFFFPLPFNDDQKDIIRRLEADESDGIVVQGPPGTGKTHTIANIICHFLATKRRVLVTAKTPEALRALQEKIPEGIRVLAVSVIHNDREGARQLQQAVEALAAEAKSINVKLVSQQIVEKQSRIAALDDTIRKIDEQFHRLAERNLTRTRDTASKRLTRWSWRDLL